MTVWATAANGRTAGGPADDSAPETDPESGELIVPPTRRVRLIIAYHGRSYHGWQIQSGVPTVQGTVTDAVGTLIGSPRTVWGASRTDAGVHAHGQVAAFDDHGERSLWEIYRGLNHFTPDDIWIRSADEVPMDFHPRHSSGGKIYEYLIEMGRYRSPFYLDRAMHVRTTLNAEAMHQAGQHLIGEHDFSAFRSAGCASRTPIRTISEVSVTVVEPRLLKIRVVGTAFLKYMVRAIAGTLVVVGRNQRPPEWVGEVLRGRDRAAGGVTAPPEGLTLVQVFHPGFPVETPP